MEHLEIDWPIFLLLLLWFLMDRFDVYFRRPHCDGEDSDG